MQQHYFRITDCHTKNGDKGMSGEHLGEGSARELSAERKRTRTRNIEEDLERVLVFAVLRDAHAWAGSLCGEMLRCTLDFCCADWCTVLSA